MKHIALAATLSAVLLLVSNLTLADYDQRDEDEAKAFEQQNREAAQKEALRKQKQEADGIKAEADIGRQVLGAKANGKSDAEVITMMQAHLDALEEQSATLQQQADKAPVSTMSDEQADRALNEAVRKASGNESMNIEDLENMSDAELEALAAKAAAQEQ